MSFRGPDFLIDQDGLSHVSKKARTSDDQTAGVQQQLFPVGAPRCTDDVGGELSVLQSTSRPLLFQGYRKKRSCPERSGPLQEERSVEKRTRLGVEIHHDRPALVELPQNLGGSPDSPAGHVVALDGHDGVPAVDVAASIVQITVALQAPTCQEHEQNAPERAVDDSDGTPSFTPRTPQPNAKTAVYGDKEWQRFFDVLQLNTPSRQHEGAAVQAVGGSQQLAGSFFLREFGRCSHTLRNRASSPGAGSCRGTPVQAAVGAAQAAPPPAASATVLPEPGASMQ